jgi:hypothetical protein
MKMMAGGILANDLIKTGIQPIYKFPIPEEALTDGKVTFLWTCSEAVLGAQVSEVWIVKE